MTKKVQTNFRFPAWLMDEMKKRKEQGHGSTREQMQTAFVEQYMQGDKTTDKDRLDWLINNDGIAHISLPASIIKKHNNLRDAIDEAMKL